MSETVTFIDKMQREIEIDVDEDACKATASHNGTHIGHIEWDVVSAGLDPAGDDIQAALLTNIFLDKAPGYTDAGIGTRIVELIGEYTGMHVLIARDTGRRRADGAHPTGDAPAFYNSLVKKGLASYDDGAVDDSSGDEDD